MENSLNKAFAIIAL